jgi:NAD(P)-dependent dehydrogenase (short-subunit alcohol dehydrogenase family)
MTPRLKGKVVFVTGAARGIGAATARLLCEDGAAVVIADVLEGEGRALARELRGAHAHVGYMKLDVSNEQQWRDAIDGTVKTFGGLHILVNNAGIATLPDVEAETVEGYRKLIDVDQLGVWLGMKTAAPAMQRSGGGSIINVSSIYGTVGGTGDAIAYHAAKGAVRTMTKNAAIHWARTGIRVNSVHPGFIDTPMVQPLVSGKDEAARQLNEFILSRTPMGRMGRPEEIAQVIAQSRCVFRHLPRRIRCARSWSLSCCCGRRSCGLRA